MDFVEVVPTLLTAKIFEEKLPATYRSKWQSCRSMAGMEGMAARRRAVVAARRGRGPSWRDLTCFIKRFVGVIASNLSEESRASDFVSILCFLF